MSLQKVVSSGQTGVERAALDSAIYRSLYWGGWATKGRLAEDGEIPSAYFEGDGLGCGMSECERGRPFTAKHRNIRDSCATLILWPSEAGKTLPDSIKLIIKSCRNLERPYRVFDPTKTYKVPPAVRWICETSPEEEGEPERRIKTLNVVGPAESKFPGAYEKTYTYLCDVLGFVHTYNYQGVKIWAPKKKTQTQIGKAK